jgi:putative hydrolase of HD superfamily
VTALLSSAAVSARAERIVDTLVGLDPLADLPRTGWLLRGVRPCESIADHSYFVALTVMLLVDALREEGVSVDGEKALRMALVHDAPEAKTGDVPMPQKTPRVDAALEELEGILITQLVPEPQQRAWREAEDGQSLEARIVKAADKIQMMTKALVYGRTGRGDLAEFWINDKNFPDKGLAIAREVHAVLRARHEAG